MLIKDILSIDLTVDIKNVIDLEDVTESEIQSEITNYIITDGLAREYADFVSKFTSNIVETGVWISGFYGSGKSYFGKLMGYMLSNRLILGTPARERIIQRFSGITDEDLIKNTLSKLNVENCRVVFLDIAKQDTSKGLSFTLFRNFLRSLNLPENEHGFLLFHLMNNESQIDVQDFVFQKLNKQWDDIKTRVIEYAKACKEIYLIQNNNEKEYESLLTTIRRDIDQFSAARLKEEISNYLKMVKNEKVVFLFDEASEAINQKKFNLLDLEGISEALSALGGKVWTIAIAQEKLDEVINNSNIDKTQLTKVTDRFKTKIHLEATEVDVIIRNRLLKKKETAVKKLNEHYQKNSGKITDHSALNATGIVKTDSLESYVTYYPFYKYQFDLLQNFLFGTKGYASTKVAARGMIITTYDILKLELQNNNLFEVATGWQIAREAQPQPQARLVNRYDNANRILKETDSKISGRYLLETIHFLSEAEVVPATLPNIIKSFINDPEQFHKMQDEISKALESLVDAKILLLANNTYRITSDIEQRLLDEMNGFTVQGFVKKKQVVMAYKSSVFLKSLARVSESAHPYDFYITTDNDDELTNPALKHLKLRIKSLYNIGDDRIGDIETLKTQHQNDKDIIWLVPDNNSFKEIDKLIDEIERITYLEQKYNNPQSDEGQIIRGFLTVKVEKENRLRELIENSLLNGVSIYLYNTNQLDKENWQSTLQNKQREVIINVYNKRLETQLSDSIAINVIKESNAARLQQYFHGQDFQFFDARGNFVGDKLKVAEEILYKIRNTFVDGITIEKDLEEPPTGFAFGSVISTLAALMRGGKVMAKYNGSEKYSYRDEGVIAIFSAAREFRKASFKAISKVLTASQKNDLVIALQSMDCEEHTGQKVDWNVSDFELSFAVRELAKRFCDKVDDMRKQNKDFNTLFADLEIQKDILSTFTGAVSEANYIEKAENFLLNKDDYNKAINEIGSVEKFIRNNLPKLLDWKSFVTGVKDELTKSAKLNETLSEFINSFIPLYGNGVVKNFTSLQNLAQKIKDEYFSLMSLAAKNMSSKYIELKSDAENLLKEISTLPKGLNEEALTKVNSILYYAEQRTVSTVELEFDIKDKKTRFTYSEILSFIELFNRKKTDLEILKASLIRETPPKPEPGKPVPDVTIRIFRSVLPSKKLKVSEYKKWLHQELQKLAGANDNDDVEINN